MPTSDLNPAARRQIATWLFSVCVLIFAMVVLGGVTRLTRSGLSMVEWAPIMGIIPPLTEQAWLETFAKYQAFPEYKHINQGMDLAGFKSIFWFEYAHRVLGRLIGFAFFVPFVVFWLRGKLTRALAPKLAAMFILGGLQGLLGWFMVKSGLVDVPHVSQYRLTAHLSLAIAIYGYMFWVALGLVLPPNAYAGRSTSDRIRPYAIALTVLIGIMIVSGGFVAGTKAGYAYNTFPLMGGDLIPQGIDALSPWYLNALENRVTIQFNHRWLAMTSGFLLLAWYWRGRSRFDDPMLSRSFKLVGMMVIIQLILGISTLLLQVPVWLGVLHQAGALLLFSVMLFNTHALSRV